MRFSYRLSLPIQSLIKVKRDLLGLPARTISFRFVGKVMTFASYVLHEIRMLYLSTFVVLLGK